MTTRLLEYYIVDEYLTVDLIKNEFFKICDQYGGWDYIHRTKLHQNIYNEFIAKNIVDIINKHTPSMLRFPLIENRCRMTTNSFIPQLIYERVNNIELGETYE